MLSESPIPERSFQNWLWQDAENRWLWASILPAIVAPFVWLKLLYPFPNFMPPDSNGYLEAAFNNQFINIWAVGYSRFLRLESVFSSSHLVLVVLQYLLLQASLLYLLFSLRYLLAPGKWLWRVLTIASVLNPLLPHIANFVSSDALFTTLSLVWFTQLLWLLYRPGRKLVLLHGLILLWAFMVRFNALYYPVISIIILLGSRCPIRLKALSIGWIALLLGVFTVRTLYTYRQETGTTQFAAFGGWQIAANALYGYAYAMPDDPAVLPQEYRELHTIVNRHMDSLRRLTHRPDGEVAVYYQWDFKSPLRVYMKQHEADTTIPFFNRWAAMGPLFAGYGRWLVVHHPKEFLRYYAWPNLVKYYVPPTKFMGKYNLGNKKADPIAVKWFHWKNNELPTHTRDRAIGITEYFPVTMAVINVLFVLGLLAFAGLNGFGKTNTLTRKIIAWAGVVWLVNMVFSVLAAPIELRYQLFPMVITLVFMVWLIAFVVEQSRNTERVSTLRSNFLS